MPENVITQKVGPLPLVVWVAGGAGAIALFIVLTHKGNNGASANQTNQISSLAPTEAEAFGTIEQQQQDVTNALTTLGNNQSALGGSMSTLTGIVTQQGSDNAAAFQNLVNGQQSIQQGETTIQQGQSAASDQATSYYNGLLQNMLNYFNATQGSLNGINSGVQSGNAANATYYQWLNQQIAGVGQQVSGVSGQVSGVGQQVAGVSGQVATDQGAANRIQQAINQMGAFLGWQWYQIPNRYTAYIPQGLNPPGWS